MKKWWFLLIIILITSLVKSGQAIALPQSIGGTPNTIVQQNGSNNDQMDNSSNGKNNAVKPVNNINWPIEYVGGNLGFRSGERIEAATKVQLRESMPIIIQLNQVQVKEIPIKKEMPIKKGIPIKKEIPQKIVKPSVYLTFDDGPNQELNQILTILKAKKAKGTFFMIEPQMKHYQDSVKRLVKEGHYPALHSVTHDKNKLYGGSPLNMVNEMEKTRKTLLKITGIDSKLTRAPYGSKPYMKDTFRNALVLHRMKMWDWNIDTMDWKYQRSNPHQILVNTINGLNRVKNTKGPIVILMHVTKGTASVLPQVIDYLYSKGYQCPAYNPSKHVIMNFWNDTRL